MKLFVVLVIVLSATFAWGEQHAFRGDFVETYMAEKGFLDTIPHGTRLNCEQTLCSFQKSVRIYVFRNGEGTRRFWSADYGDVMFDEPENILACGRGGHIVHYDETGQLMSRDEMCGETSVKEAFVGPPGFDKPSISSLLNRGEHANTKSREGGGGLE